MGGVSIGDRGCYEVTFDEAYDNVNCRPHATHGM